MPGKDTVWIEVDILHEGAKAWKISDSKTDAWLPKSQVLDSEEDIRVGYPAKIEVPMWWAEKEGFS